MTTSEIRKIPYTKPSITPLEVEFATDAAANGWGEHCYDYIVRFEEAFKAHLGVNYAIATSSCTGALHMGMHALGIGPGDEVIMADTNWIATAAPIVHLGATPVFVDILPDSWCLDPEQVEAAITPNTKAIVAVHLYGNLCDMNALLAIGERHGIPVIEDAAEAVGSMYHGKRAGSMGHFGAFSFHGTKTITTGEGGMFVTNDPDFYEKVLTLSNHGRARKQSKQFWPDMLGYKYKLSNIQAAIGCAQIERIDTLAGRKREIFMNYKNYISKSFDGFYNLNPEPNNCLNGYWMPTIVGSSPIAFQIERLIATFKTHRVDARVAFWPLSTTPIKKFCRSFSGSNSASFHLKSINLPSPFDLTHEEQLFIVNILSKHLKLVRSC